MQTGKNIGEKKCEWLQPEKHFGEQRSENMQVESMQIVIKEVNSCRL